jgi:hypothetical protein
VTGAVLVAVDLLPQPFLTMLILAAALAASGVALHLLRDRLVPSRVPPSLDEPSPDQGLGGGEDNPWTRARALELDHHARQLRKALRSVAEDELDNLNQRRLAMFVGGLSRDFSPATAQWSAHCEFIKEHAEAEVYRKGATAYAGILQTAEQIERRGPDNALVRALAEAALKNVGEAVEAMREAQP